MLTPPLGICLIASSSISHARLTSICRQIAPFLLVLLAELAIITSFPPLTLLLAGLIHECFTDSVIEALPALLRRDISP
jgi:C4-dicarboxylate transporter DctM subunit